MKGINILMMLICFNIGIYLISLTGLYNVGTGIDPTVTTWGIVIGNLGLTALLTTAGAAGGAIVSFLAGADPLRGGAIGLFAGVMTSMWTSVGTTFNSFANSIEPSGAGTIHVGIAVFMAFNVILLFYFFIQFAGGGWKAIE